MSDASGQWYGAVQIDTRCFLLLLGLGLFLCIFDRRSGDGSRSIRIWKAFLGVGVWKTIGVGQALRLLRLLRRHANIDVRAGATWGNANVAAHVTRWMAAGEARVQKNG
jgi:hypothetical protein